VNRWLLWSAHHFTPSISILGWENMVKKIVGAGDPDPYMVTRGEALVTDCATVLDAHLARRRWVSGDRLTLADYALSSPLMAIGPAKLPVTGFENLMGWFGRVQELDAWKKTSPSVPPHGSRH
jgi:glutathione S-transferase